MKIFFLFFVIILIHCGACFGNNKTIHIAGAICKDTIKTTSQADGSSYEKAIIIKQQHENQGVNEEYGWIRNQYPNSKVINQSLSYHDKKPFDIINIITAESKKIAIYFDISNFFGKF